MASVAIACVACAHPKPAAAPEVGKPTPSAAASPVVPAAATLADADQQLAEAEARFDKLWRVREDLLHALQGQPKPEPQPAKPAESDKEQTFARCRAEALDAVKDELSAIDDELDLREWELSPRTVRLRRNERLLRALANRIGGTVAEGER